jgi:hypothetical protein
MKEDTWILHPESWISPRRVRAARRSGAAMRRSDSGQP